MNKHTLVIDGSIEPLVLLFILNFDMILKT